MATQLTYPVVMNPDDNGYFTVTLPDFPGATYGKTEAEALKQARALLVDVIDNWMTLRRPLPEPSSGKVRVALPPSMALKVAIYQEMLSRGLTKTALAARMRQPKQQLERLFKLTHRSRADQIDAAYEALNLTLTGLDLEAQTGPGTLGVAVRSSRRRLRPAPRSVKVAATRKR